MKRNNIIFFSGHFEPQQVFYSSWKYFIFPSLSTCKHCLLSSESKATGLLLRFQSFRHWFYFLEHDTWINLSKCGTFDTLNLSIHSFSRVYLPFHCRNPFPQLLHPLGTGIWVCSVPGSAAEPKFAPFWQLGAQLILISVIFFTTYRSQKHLFLHHFNFTKHFFLINWQ